MKFSFMFKSAWWFKKGTLAAGASHCTGQFEKKKITLPSTREQKENKRSDHPIKTSFDRNKFGN